MKTTELLLDMKESDKTILLDILDRLVPAGLEVWAFGSRARWTARETSDLDLVLRNPAQLETRLEAGILDDLKEAFEESDLPFMVDLLDWATVSEKFRKVIEREYVVVRKGGCVGEREGWKKIKLENALEALIDYRGKTPNKTASGIPLITAKIVKNGFIQEPNEFIAEEDYDSWMVRGFPKIGDVVLTMEAPLGEVAQINDERVALAQRIVTLRGKEGLLDNTYLKFFFKSETGQARLKERETGTTVTGIKQSELRLVEIDVPPLSTQCRIASILSALDEKIELNRQTNQTLEAITQALFKEWFMDFNFPGATGEMQESELGPIPKGWRVGTLGDVCKNIRKTVHPKEVVADTPYVGLEHIPRKSLGLFSWGVSSDVDSQKTHFKKYNVLFGKLRPYFHKVCIAPLEGICSTDILVIEPLKDDNFSFCLNHLFSNEMITFVSSVADGTRMPRVDWRSISNYEIVVPPESLLSRFNRITLPFYDHIIENNQQAAILSVSRDALLPKLMNGEIAA